MSILIKGMEMPTSCFDCDCAEIYGDGYFHCNRIGETFEEDDFRMARHPDCPMIELPPHGRLIDADMMEKECCHGCKYENNKYANCIDCALANAPTIIPAEEET